MYAIDVNGASLRAVPMRRLVELGAKQWTGPGSGGGKAERRVASLSAPETTWASTWASAAAVCVLCTHYTAPQGARAHPDEWVGMVAAPAAYPI